MSRNMLNVSGFKLLMASMMLTHAMDAVAQPVSATLAVSQPAPEATAQHMTLSSPDFPANGRLKMAQVGCTGKGISPALQWANIPAGTQSLVLTVYDPDAPTGSGFWHWVAYNLPAQSTGLPAGAGSDNSKLPEGASQLNNDGGQPGFTGACPPVGDKPHRYIFTLYALKTRLDLPAQVSPAYLGFNLNGKVLAKVQLTGYYSR